MDKQKKITKPVYQQIAIDIASRIANGEFPEGTRISGRSTLAGQYNVSPETIRRSVSLLEDMDIVAVTHGSGILVESVEHSMRFINQFKEVDSIAGIKTAIADLLREREALDQKLRESIDRVLDYTVRFKTSNPFAPLEMEIPGDSHLIGKAIGEVNFWQNTGATIIAVKRGDELILSPGPYMTFQDNDAFLMVGDEDSYNRVRHYVHQKKQSPP
ncbi:Transcriptional regulator, GntR family [Clostridiaceae bacterium JG1575]|nr:Transcriptional regulator, GntR family [Clostridiaceae bacterium JG1575]